MSPEEQLIEVECSPKLLEQLHGRVQKIITKTRNTFRNVKLDDVRFSATLSKDLFPNLDESERKIKIDGIDAAILGLEFIDNEMRPFQEGVIVKAMTHLSKTGLIGKLSNDIEHMEDEKIQIPKFLNQRVAIMEIDNSPLYTLSLHLEFFYKNNSKVPNLDVKTGQENARGDIGDSSKKKISFLLSLVKKTRQIFQKRG